MGVFLWARYPCTGGRGAGVRAGREQIIDFWRGGNRETPVPRPQTPNITHQTPDTKHQTPILKPVVQEAGAPEQGGSREGNRESTFGEYHREHREHLAPEFEYYQDGSPLPTLGKGKGEPRLGGDGVERGDEMDGGRGGRRGGGGAAGGGKASMEDFMAKVKAPPGVSGLFKEGR